MGISPAILAKMNAKVVNFQGIGRGGEQITAEDLAGSLAGLPEAAWNIAQLRYVGSERHRQRIEAWLLSHMVANCGHWKSCSIGQKAALAKAAVLQFCPDQRCENCKGRRSIPDAGGIPRPCEACGGKGWVRLTQVDISASLGVDPRNYRQTWAPRMRGLTSMLTEMDSMIADALERLLDR